MAWLLSCFRCKQRRQCRSSSTKANCKIAVENAVLRNVLEAQDVVQEERKHSYTSLEQSLDASNQGNDADRSLLSFFRTDAPCFSPRKRSSDQPLQKEELQQVKGEFRRVKDLKSEGNDLQDLDPPKNFRMAFHDLHVDSEEGQAEKGRHMAHLHSVITKIESEGETLVVDNLTLEVQNKLDYNNWADIGESLSSSTKNESKLYDIEASKKFPSSFSLGAQKELRLNFEDISDMISSDKTLLERTFQNSRGCSSETKAKHSDRRRDDSFESIPQNIEEPLMISRLKRSSKALSFSEFSLVESAADGKFTSSQLEFEDSRKTESPVTRQTINRMAALKGERDGEISTNPFANISGSLPTSSEQAISLSLSQDVALYDTDMEVDSKAVKPYSNESSHSRPHGHVQTLKIENAHEVDLTMEHSQAFTFEDSYKGSSEAFSQLFTENNIKRKVLDEEVEELDLDQMSNCSDASSFLTSPLERNEVFVRKRAHLHATAGAVAMPQENTAESSAQCGKFKFDRGLGFASIEAAGWMEKENHESLNLDTLMFSEETNSKEINLPEEGRKLSGNIADLVSGYKLLPSNLSDDVTSRQELTPSRRLINMSPDSPTYSSIDHMKGITCNEFTSLEAASFSVPSPETVTYMKHMQSPSPLGAKESSTTTQRIMLNLPQEKQSVSKSVLEISSTNFLKQQPTPRTPSASSSQVETPNSIQSAVSPVDLAKDRPIMGTVAAHWSHSSSKEQWDGKGIPNSTNKYKEDQKVSWHATPFEVRLERALAKQGRVLQKKLFGGAMPTEMELRTEPISSSG